MKKKHLQDFSGYCFKFIRKHSLILQKRYFSFWKRIECWLRGIELGKRCDFFGQTQFYRNPLSILKIGNGCSFRSSFSSNLVGLNHKCLITTMREGAELRIANNCGISGATISAAFKITIHSNVLIGANVLITDFDWHNIDPSKRHQPNTNYAPVEIKENAWIGINSVILKGVTIGKNSVIGANSLVTSDIPDNVIAAGNPCKILKHIQPDE